MNTSPQLPKGLLLILLTAVALAAVAGVHIALSFI